MYRDDYYDGYYDDYNDRYVYDYDPDDELYHFGVKGMKWGIRRFQNRDGSPTAAGRGRYGSRNGVNWKKVGRTAARVAGVAALAGGTALAIKNRQAIGAAAGRLVGRLRGRNAGTALVPYSGGNGGMTAGRVTRMKETVYRSKGAFQKMGERVRNAAGSFAGNVKSKFARKGPGTAVGAYTGGGMRASSGIREKLGRSFYGKGAGASFRKAAAGAQARYKKWRDTGTTQFGNKYVSNRILVNNAKRYGKYGAAALGAGAGLGAAAAGAQRVRNRRNRKRG